MLGALREDRIGDGGYSYVAVGYDDEDFQRSTRATSATTDFFNDFAMTNPIGRTAVESSWLMHAVFDIQELTQGGDLSSVPSVASRNFASVPSKLLRDGDGPVQVLTRCATRQLEVVMQVATPHHFLSRCVRVRMSAPQVQDHYPADLGQRRAMFQRMIDDAPDLRLRQIPGNNPAQLKVSAEWPPQEGESAIHLSPNQMLLVAVGFDVKFEGYSGTFSCKALLAARWSDWPVDRRGHRLHPDPDQAAVSSSPSKSRTSPSNRRPDEDGRSDSPSRLSRWRSKAREASPSKRISSLVNALALSRSRSKSPNQGSTSRSKSPTASSSPTRHDDDGIGDGEVVDEPPWARCETILPKSSYRCSTDEPAHYHRGRLTVRLISASALPAADITGTSDPYCRLCVVHHGANGDEQQSSTVASSLDPVWDQEFTFEVAHGYRDVLLVRVMDYDRVGSDDYLGHLALPIIEVSRREMRPQVVERDFDLQPAKKGSHPLKRNPRGGTVRMRLEWTKTLVPKAIG